MPETDTVTDKIHNAFSRYPKRHYPKGSIIVFAEESPEHIFYIVKGKVIKYDVSYRGDEVIINIFKPSAFFPLSWAINKESNSYFYKADEDTDVHIVPAADTVNFLQANPDVMYDLLSRIYRGLEGMTSRMVLLMSGTAKNRLVFELLIEARRFGDKQTDGKIKLNLNESDLANRAGLTRETVSREMRKIKSAKLVSIEKRGIVVNDMDALEAAA